MEDSAQKDAPSLKLRTARTIKWNSIDRVSSQLIYAVVGVVLANLLSKEDFGLVGALTVFQAFGILFVDSGFGTALLQKKHPSRTDYSTVFWFNMCVSVVVYVILFFAAPLIADIFQGDTRLIPLSRVMFLSFILNGLGIVQTTRLMKTMNVKQIAVANVVGLTCSGVVGVSLALGGYGAWALVWQTVTLAFVKSAWLWISGGWLPRIVFSTQSIRQIWRMGLSVFSTSALSQVFLYIYSFVIGAFYNLVSLAIYTQADKWSKMGTASFSQVFTASFVPLLSRFQDDGENFHRYVTKINRFAAFILFPVMTGIAVIGTPLFHMLFATKWDTSIILFQILTIRGIFIVLMSLYNNYLLALGYARKLFIVEMIKDAMILVAILSTVWFDSLVLLVWGQFAASLVTYFIILRMVSRAIGMSSGKMLRDLLPFAFYSLLMGAVCLLLKAVPAQLPEIAASGIRVTGLMQLMLMTFGGVAFYIVALRTVRSKELSDASAYIFGRFHKKL